MKKKTPVAKRRINTAPPTQPANIGIVLFEEVLELLLRLGKFTVCIRGGGAETCRAGGLFCGEGNVKVFLVLGLGETEEDGGVALATGRSLNVVKWVYGLR